MGIEFYNVKKREKVTVDESVVKKVKVRAHHEGRQAERPLLHCAAWMTAPS